MPIPILRNFQKNDFPRIFTAFHEIYFQKIFQISAKIIAWHVLLVYSVMQSAGNNFWGYVVLDSFKMVYSDEDSILYQKYEKRIFRNLY